MTLTLVKCDWCGCQRYTSDLSCWTCKLIDGAAAEILAVSDGTMATLIGDGVTPVTYEDAHAVRDTWLAWAMEAALDGRTFYSWQQSWHAFCQTYLPPESILTFEQCADRWPRLTRAMQWVLCGSVSEAACCIRDYLRGEFFGSSAVSHSGLSTGHRIRYAASFNGRRYPR